MSNLLNRMAARAIGTAPLAKPIVPALFTPTAGSAQNATELGGSVLHSDVEAAVPSSTSANSGTLHRDTVNDPAGQDFSASRVEPLRTMQRPQETVHPNAFFSTADTLPMPEAALHSDSESPALSRSDARVTAETNIDQAEQVPVDSVIATHTTPATLPSTVQSRVNPLLPAQSHNALRHDRTQRAAAEPPVVRVTIGRIDVRAQFSAAASSSTPVARTRPATLTMDEYLKQRNEGKR